jgi:5-methyltetrahydropteroyltriglutamate--homocysteine methyltransferase
MGYLNSLRADHVVLECRRRPADELSVFKELDARIGMGLGVVDIKTTEVESPDDIARAIERAESVIGGGRVRYVHPDCGFWMLPRSVADAKIRALVEGRDLYLGRLASEPDTS